MSSKVSIPIPSHLQHKCGRCLHWDFYQADVKLKSGKIIRNLSVREAVAFVPIQGEDSGKYYFKTADIENVRPATLFSRIKTFFNGW
jgi:hypothetical protein